MSDSTAAQHVIRTLRALELLAEGPRTQADVATHLDVHRRTARRLLARLEEEGYVKTAANGPLTAFEATARLILLGRMVADQLDLGAIGQSHVEGADDSGVDSWLITFADRPGIWIGDKGPSAAQRAARTSEPTARRDLLHTQADGKIFLSADTTLMNDILNQNLLNVTAQTITTRADLLLELATVRTRGFATEVFEHDPDLRVVASGVTDHTGRTVAAVSAVVEAGGSVDGIGERVRSVAEGFSNDIGGA